MIQKTHAPMLAMLAIALLVTTSCATRKIILTAGDLEAVLSSIPVGESRYVEVVGVLRPYSGSMPKGRGLLELAVGDKILLIRSFGLHSKDEAPYFNKVVSARVKVSHYPLADSHPASQIGGHWITEVTQLKSAE